MKHKAFKDLTDEELRNEKNKVYHNKLINASLIGCCIGIFLYSAVTNGFGFFTFFPLLLIYPFSKNGKKIKQLTEEFNARNL